MKNQVGIPKGMRDFSPITMAKRNYIFNCIKKHFRLHGFEQIETPAMENRETLTGKYGEEGDRLLFNILQRGDKLHKSLEGLKNTDSTEGNLTHLFLESGSDLALRYDLTVPFARYVVQHQHEIVFPFKRFQIQPVWRADRPQKGRYREFYQCDVDTIGTASLLAEVEFVQLFDEVLSELGFTDFSIKINNRKVLSGIAELIGRPEKIIDITIAIDKLEKIGKEKVKQELLAKGLVQEEIERLDFLFEMKGANAQLLSNLRKELTDNQVGLDGIKELEEILAHIESIDLKHAKVEVDLTLARGLNYYTGAIFEVVSNQAKMGSICGGGRYADLTGIFGLKDMPGVGISFGADRIYDLMEELQLFPNQLGENTSVMFVNFGAESERKALRYAQELRKAGISTEIYPEADKMKKQFKYADQKQIPYVILIGEEELAAGKVTLKNMGSGAQEQLSFSELIQGMT